MVRPRRAVKGSGPSCPHGRRPTRYGTYSKPSPAITDLSFHPCAVDCIRDANTGTYRNRAIVLNHSHEGLPVRDIRQPIFEAVAKEVGVIVAYWDGRSISRYNLREHVGGSSPDTIDRSVGG